MLPKHLARPPLAKILLSVAFAAASGAIAQVTVLWLVVELTNSPIVVSFAVAARTLPRLLVGLPAGGLADRFDRRVVTFTADIFATAVLTAAAVTAASTRGPKVVEAIAVMFCVGVSQTIRTASVQAMAHSWGSRDQAVASISLANLTFQLLTAAGGVVAGVVLGGHGAAVAFAVSAALYLIAAISILTVSAEFRHTAEAPRQVFGAALTLLTKERDVRQIAVLVGAAEVFGFAALALLPIFAEGVYHSGAIGLGTLTGVLSMGGAIALVWFAARRTTSPTRLQLLAVCATFGAALMLFALAPEIVIGLLPLAVVGACSALIDTLAQTLLQDAVPAAQRGAAMGIWLFGVGFGLLGSIAIGYAASRIGAPATQLVSGLLLVMSVAVGLRTSLHFDN